MDNRSFGERICYCRRCNGIVYVVKKGDTIFNIAGRFGITVNDILNENRFINVYNLQAGDRICIPITPPMPPVSPYFMPEEEMNQRNRMDDRNNMNNMNEVNERSGMNDINMNTISNESTGDNGMEIDYSADGAFEYNELEAEEYDNEKDTAVQTGILANDVSVENCSSCRKESDGSIKVSELINSSNMTVEEFVKYIKRFDK